MPKKTRKTAQDQRPLTEDVMVELVCQQFHCLGGSKPPNGHSLMSHLMAGNPPCFAHGVDVRDVVRFVTCNLEAAAEVAGALKTVKAKP